jgi:hypothetical protein
LIGTEVVGRSDAGARGADVEGLRELDELDTGSVYSAKKNGYLEANAWRAALNAVQALTLLVNLDFQDPPVVPANQYDYAYSMPGNERALWDCKCMLIH